jgi:hypothetical protein
MLSILSKQTSSFCDRGSRRHFLKIGGLALGGLALPDLLRAEASSASRGAVTSPHKAIIMIYLSGGPSHQDMYDLKMEAPVEIRGSFRPIATNITGIQICEHMPRRAHDGQIRDNSFALCGRGPARLGHVFERLPDRPTRKAERPALARFGAFAIAGPRRSHGSAFCRPDYANRTRPLFESWVARLCGVGARRVPAKRRSHGQHASERRHARPTPRSPDVAI